MPAAAVSRAAGYHQKAWEGRGLTESGRQGVEIGAGCVSTGDQHRLVTCPLVVEDMDPWIHRYRFITAVANDSDFIVEVR